MKDITENLKNQIQNLNTIEERLNLLENKYKGETAYLVTCGPSLANHDDNILMDKLRDKLVLSVKQAHDVVGDISDFHLLNTYNLKEYHYLVENTIVIWSVSKSYAYNQLQRIQNKPLDIYFPVINPPYITEQDTIAGKLNFDDMKLLNQSNLSFDLHLRFRLIQIWCLWLLSNQNFLRPKYSFLLRCPYLWNLLLH